MTAQQDPFFDAGAPATLLRMHKGLFWTGVVMIVLGMGAILMPMISSLIVELLVGWLLLMSGLLSLTFAFSLRRTGLFVWQLVAGLAPLAAGLMLVLFPLQGLIALTVLVAAILVLTGVAQLAFAFWARPVAGWGWSVLSALVSIILGAYIFMALPAASTMVLGLLVGIDFVSTGIALVLIAQSVRRSG